MSKNWQINNPFQVRIGFTYSTENMLGNKKQDESIVPLSFQDRGEEGIFGCFGFQF